MEDSLHDFIRKAREQGQTADQIQQELVGVGWDPAEVVKAMQEVFSAPTVNRTFLPVQDVYNLSTNNPATTTYSIPNQNPVKYAPRTFSQTNPEPQTQIVRKFLPVRVALSIVAFLLVGSAVVGGTYFYITARSGDVAQNSTGVQENSLVNANNSNYIRFVNTEYKFSLNIPRTWSVKDFEPSSYVNEKRFAFGLIGDLPQEVFNQGKYIWLKIYSVDNRTSYGDFQYLKTLIGKNQGVFTAELGGEAGLRSGDFYAAEHEGRVYELHLVQLYKEINDARYFSEESEEALRSFRFE